MLPFPVLKATTATALALVCLVSSVRAAPVPLPAEFPSDTTRIADRQLFFETNLGLIERATAEAVDQALEGLKLPPGSDILLHSVTQNEGSWFVEDFIARRLNQQGYNVHVPKEPSQISTPITPTSPTTTPAAGGTGAPPASLAEATRIAEASRKPNTGATGDSTGTLSAARDSATTVQNGSTTQTNQTTTPGPRGRKKSAAANPDEEIVEIPVPEGQGLVLTIRLVEFGVTYHDSWRRGFMGPRVVERLASVNLYCRLVSDGPQNVLWVGRGKSERLDVVPKSKLDLLEGLSYPFAKPTLRPQRLSRLLEPVLVTSIISGLVYLFYTNQK